LELRRKVKELQRRNDELIAKYNSLVEKREILKLAVFAEALKAASMTTKNHNPQAVWECPQCGSNADILKSFHPQFSLVFRCRRCNHEWSVE